jgi:hypothetical protein
VVVRAACSTKKVTVLLSGALPKVVVSRDFESSEGNPGDVRALYQLLRKAMGLAAGARSADEDGVPDLVSSVAVKEGCLGMVGGGDWMGLTLEPYTFVSRGTLCGTAWSGLLEDATVRWGWRWCCSVLGMKLLAR